MLVNLSEAKLNPLLIVESSDLCICFYVDYDGLSVRATPHNVVNTGFKSSALARKKGYVY